MFLFLTEGSKGKAVELCLSRSCNLGDSTNFLIDKVIDFFKKIFSCDEECKKRREESNKKPK